MEFTTRLLVKQNMRKPFSDVFVFSARQLKDHMGLKLIVPLNVSCSCNGKQTHPCATKCWSRSTKGKTGGVSGSALQCGKSNPLETGRVGDPPICLERSGNL